MLTIVASGLSVAGLALVARKLSSSMKSMLDLSDDLNPPRVLSSRHNSPDPARATLTRGNEPCVESMLRLSGAVAGSRNTSSDVKPVSIGTEVHVA